MNANVVAAWSNTSTVVTPRACDRHREQRSPGTSAEPRPPSSGSRCMISVSTLTRLTTRSPSAAHHRHHPARVAIGWGRRGRTSRGDSCEPRPARWGFGRQLLEGSPGARVRIVNRRRYPGAPESGSRSDVRKLQIRVAGRRARVGGSKPPASPAGLRATSAGPVREGPKSPSHLLCTTSRIRLESRRRAAEHHGMTTMF